MSEKLSTGARTFMVLLALCFFGGGVAILVPVVALKVIGALVLMVLGACIWLAAVLDE